MDSRVRPAPTGTDRPGSRDLTVVAACALIDEFGPALNAIHLSGEGADLAALIRDLMLVEQAIAQRSDEGSLPASDAIRYMRRATTLARLLERREAETTARATLDDELDAATTQLCRRFGFDRTMAFGVRPTGLYISATCFARAKDWRDDMHRRMIEKPPPMDLPGREAQVVHEGCALIVDHAQDDPHTWKPLVDPGHISSYVSAPIRLHGATVATLHADRWFQRAEVSIEDRDLVACFANEVSLRLERCVRPERGAGVLTDQQRRVLEGVASGLSNRQIADALVISAETVKSHLANIYRQLEVSNRVEALGKYYDLDLAPPR